MNVKYKSNVLQSMGQPLVWLTVSVFHLLLAWLQFDSCDSLWTGGMRIAGNII